MASACLRKSMPSAFLSRGAPRARLVFAALLAITALNHGRLAAAGGANVTRHGVFVGLNLALAWLLVARPRWALLPAALLSVQQLYSHARARPVRLGLGGGARVLPGAAHAARRRAANSKYTGTPARSTPRLVRVSTGFSTISA